MKKEEENASIVESVLTKHSISKTSIISHELTCLKTDVLARRIWAKLYGTYL